MWNLSNLANSKILRNVIEDEGGERLRNIFRAALSIEDSQALTEDLVVAIREVLSLENEDFNV